MHSAWRDPSGAALLFHGGDSSIDCLTPWYEDPDRPAPPWRVRIAGPTADPGCRHCGGADVDLLDEDGSLLTRAGVQFALYAPWEERLADFGEGRLDVVAFAEQAGFHRTPAEFRLALDFLGWAEGPGLADRAFMPTGMFGPLEDGGMTRRATALFTGEVRRVVRRANRRTGSEFWSLVVESYPGPLAVVSSISVNRPPAVGDQALVSAWLVGRPSGPWWPG